MKVFKAENNLCSVILCLFLSQASFFVDVEKEVAAVNVVKDHIEREGCLECVLQLHNELVIHF